MNKVLRRIYAVMVPQAFFGGAVEVEGLGVHERDLCTNRIGLPGFLSSFCLPGFFIQDKYPAGVQSEEDRDDRQTSPGPDLLEEGQVISILCYKVSEENKP